ncbi:MAG: ImmA/IrrE family metallo-endopeptidase [Zoogloeaceae bacterium]|nr:ImmA/IrrE family metallo-endopeptidase [Zoogloeaceae bacterium]
MFERGFKAWCEKYSTSIRKDLGLNVSGALDMCALAEHLGIRVWSPNSLPGLSTETQAILLRNDPNSRSDWSAVTVVAASRIAVILNTSHSEGRQASDLAHELAHLIRGHESKGAGRSTDGILLLSDYEKQQEEEANWLSGCLLLPREALVSIKQRRLTDEEAAREYCVSRRLLKYRNSMTGVDRQFSSTQT